MAKTLVPRIKTPSLDHLWPRSRIWGDRRWSEMSCPKWITKRCDRVPRITSKRWPRLDHQINFCDFFDHQIRVIRSPTGWAYLWRDRGAFDSSPKPALSKIPIIRPTGWLSLDLKLNIFISFGYWKYLNYHFQCIKLFNAQKETKWLSNRVNLLHDK